LTGLCKLQVLCIIDVFQVVYMHRHR